MCTKKKTVQAFVFKKMWDFFKKGNSLPVQWLGLHCRGQGSIPGQGTKIPHAMWLSQKKVRLHIHTHTYGCSPGGEMVKNPPANAEDLRLWFNHWDRKIPWRRARQPTPVFFPGECHGQRSLVGQLQSMGSQRVRPNWPHIYIYIHIFTYTYTQSCLYRHIHICFMYVYIQKSLNFFALNNTS